MAQICNRHSFEYAENVCSSCGLPFCHDCLVYPRGPKKPPFCVNCAIAEAGVRSSARNPTNLSRRQVKKRVREAKNMHEQAQPHTEAAPLSQLARDEHDFELTSNASFDQGWAVSWDEGRDPHPGYPEPVHVNWGTDPSPAAPPAVVVRTPPIATPQPEARPPMPAARPAFVAKAEPEAAPAPASQRIPTDEPEVTRTADLPRLQPVELARGHAPTRPGGLPSVRPPLKQPGTDLPRQKLSAGANAPIPPQQPRVYGGAPATRPDAPAPAAPPAPGGRLRRKEETSESSEMLGWLDHLIKTEEEQGPRS